MSSDFFDRLELELGGLTRAGTHLGAPAGWNRRHLLALARHGVTIVLLAVVLAASLVSEFPASAGGQPLVARISHAPQAQRSLTPPSGV
jgi:hypothetical protein